MAVIVEAAGGEKAEKVGPDGSADSAAGEEDAPAGGGGRGELEVSK